MKKWALLIALASTCAVSATLPHAQGRSDDERSVRELVDTYVAARERVNPEAIGALFTEEADQLTSSGEWRRGREALVAGTMRSSQANAGRRTITIRTVRFPAPDVAIADGEYVIAGASGTRNMWTSFLLVRRGGGWQIDAIRNMLPAAPQ